MGVGTALMVQLVGKGLSGPPPRITDMAPEMVSTNGPDGVQDHKGVASALRVQLVGMGLSGPPPRITDIAQEMVSPNGPGGVQDDMHAKSALIVQLALGSSVPQPMCDAASGALVGLGFCSPHLILSYHWVTRG